MKGLAAFTLLLIVAAAWLTSVLLAYRLGERREFTVATDAQVVAPANAIDLDQLLGGATRSETDLIRTDRALTVEELLLGPNSAQHIGDRMDAGVVSQPSQPCEGGVRP